MTTWAALKLEVGRKVYDLDADKYAEAALSAVNDALVFIAATHTGMPSMITLEAEGEKEFTLPSEVVRVVRVTDSYDEEIEQQTNFGESGYMVWGNTIIVSPAPTYDMTAYVECYFPSITGDESVIQVPPWMLEPIKLYSASRVLEDPGCQFSLLNQFKTRVDSGTPEDVPIMTMAKHYMREFHELLNRHTRRFI